MKLNFAEYTVKSQKASKPIIAIFEHFKDRKALNLSTFNLKGSGFRLSEQNPPEILASRKKHILIQSEARK